MTNEIIGRVYSIGATRSIQSKDGSKAFSTRELILDCTRYDSITGAKMFENYPQLEFSNDRCAELDKFKVGDVVKVFFDLRGSRYTDSSGQTKHFTKVQGYRIESFSQYQPAQKNAPTVQQPQKPTPQQNLGGDLPF